jgi:hypothetical protein
MQIPVNSQRTLVQQRDTEAPEAKIAGEMIAATQLPDGYVAQLQTDIAAFPTAWLQRFQQEDVSVAVLKNNQTLADTPVLHDLSPAEIDKLVQGTKPLVSAAVAEVMEPIAEIADPGERAYRQRMAADELQSKLFDLSNNKGVGFSVQVGREPVTLQYLGETCGFDPEYDPEPFARWKDALLEVNAGLLQQEGDQVTPTQGFTVIPYVMYKGKNVRAISLPDYQKFTGLQFQNNLGGNYPDNRLVILHESVVPNPSTTTGHHRVALHELGHMLDWICRDLPETRATHEKKVIELFKIAHDRADRSQADPFLTDRAKDSPGEMMAEAVEAYLTLPEPAQDSNFYKAANHREELKVRFPELYNYVDFLMHLPEAGGKA